jgi:DNA polymerase-1
LAKIKKLEPNTNEIVKCQILPFTHLSMLLVPNYQAILFNPKCQELINESLLTFTKYLQGDYSEPGIDIVHNAYYPTTLKQITETLQKLHKYAVLTCDIETTSLQHYHAQIESIAFAPNKHTFYAFCIHRDTLFPEAQQKQELLKEFFTTYTGTIIWHNAGYDCKILVHALWMRHRVDYEQMLIGLDVMTKKIEDTKLIAYAATNNAIQNELGLKALAASYTGNYAVDVKNISDIKTSDLLLYNGKDCLATWYVYQTYWIKLHDDDQMHLYKTLLRPLIKPLIQMELCGMPIDKKQVQAVKAYLKYLQTKHLTYLQQSSLIATFNKNRLIQKALDKTKKAKQKVYSLTDVYEEFNPASTLQLQELLYTYMGLPVLDQTKKKQPATGGGTLKKLLNHVTTDEEREILTNLIGLAEVEILLTTFITAFETAQKTAYGYRLYGSFNNGGTQSIRLSANRP